MQFLVFLIAVTLGTFGGLCYTNWKALGQIQTDITTALDLRAEVRHLVTGPYDQTNWQALRLIRHKSPEPPERRAQLTLLIAAYSSHNLSLTETRLKNFETSEKEIFISLRKQSQVILKKVMLYGAAALLIPFFGLMVFSYYLKVSIFHPLTQLSKRMMDFLTDRYSFKFSIPEDNEIGDLQRTFNSLAQRVLNNMDDLKALDRAKSEFLSIASHELRTPMTSIKGSLSLLRGGVMGPLDETVKRLIQIAEKETDRLVRLINDLLDLAKIEARSFNLQRTWVNLDDLLEKSLEGLLGLSQSAGVRLKMSTPSTSIEIFADPDRLQQIITNLVSNAIKFSPRDGLVEVAASINPGHVLLIEVRDEGRGISEEDQLHIFERFSQASNSANPLVKGTGLGLAIAKAMIEEHGGEIGVNSHLNLGSTFFFTIHEWRTASAHNWNENTERMAA